MIHGNVLLLLALFSTTVAMFLYTIASTKETQLIKYAEIAKYISLTFLLVIIAVIIKMFVVNDFSYAYVTAYSNTSLPTIYKIYVALVANESSLIFTSILIIIFGSISSRRSFKVSINYYATFNVCILFFAFLLTLLAYDSNKIFLKLSVDYADGVGLPTFLRNYNFFVYTLSWFIALVGSIIIFCNAYATLIVKDYCSYWIRNSVGWAFITFVTVLLYVFFGYYWFVNEFFEFKVWGWGVVGIASVLPLMVIIPFMHIGSSFVNKGNFSRINFFYPYLLLVVVLFSGYMVRSGLSNNSIYLERLVANLSLIWIIFFATIFYIPVYLWSLRLMPKKKKKIIDSLKFHPLTIINILFILAVVFGILVVILNVYHLVMIGELHKIDSAVFTYFAVVVLCLFAIYLAVYYINRYRSKELFTYHGISLKLKYVLVHVGAICIVLGFILSDIYNTENTHFDMLGEKTSINGYNFVVNGIKTVYKDETSCLQAEVSVSNDRKKTILLYPEMCMYDKEYARFFRTDSTIIGVNTVSVALVGYDTSISSANIAITVRSFLFLIPLGIVLLLLGLYFLWLNKRIY